MHSRKEAQQDNLRMPKLPAYHTLAAPEFRKKITEVELTPEAERAMGIEPTWPAWKAGTLPLSYARNYSNFCQDSFDRIGGSRIRTCEG